MPELALDHDERHALVSHLDRVSVPKLMGRESAANAGNSCDSPQLLASGRRLPMSAGCHIADHAQERSDR
jgi:hypothetical protein